MDLESTLERYRRMDRMIRRESTGPPCDFARRLGISRSQLYNCLDELRVRGACIQFNKCKRSYTYTKPVEVRAEFCLTFPKEDEPD